MDHICSFLSVLAVYDASFPPNIATRLKFKEDRDRISGSRKQAADSYARPEWIRDQAIEVS